jgi:hypothetical protein
MEVMLAKRLANRLKELNADTEFDACSGLSVEVNDGEIEIFDDYARAKVIDPVATLTALENVEPINWTEHDRPESGFSPLWDAISMVNGH